MGSKGIRVYYIGHLEKQADYNRPCDGTANRAKGHSLSYKIMGKIEKTKKSKRQAFRFSCDSHPVIYKTAFEDGEASLENISTTGCALREPTVPLSLEEKVLVCIDLGEEVEKIEATGRVVRQDEKITALQFSLIEADTVKFIQTHFFKVLREQKQSP